MEIEGQIQSSFWAPLVEFGAYLDMGGQGDGKDHLGFEFGHMDGWMDGWWWVDGWQMDGGWWMNGWVVGEWMDGWQVDG